MGDVDMFDNPEYYKAALEQEQRENTSLKFLVLELRRQLAIKEKENAELKSNCNCNRDRIITLEESNALLVAENKELSIYRKDQNAVKEQMRSFFSKPKTLSEIDYSHIITLFPGGMHHYLGFYLSVYNDIIQRIRILEAAVMQANPTTMNIAGDFVMNKDHFLK